MIPKQGYKMIAEITHYAFKLIKQTIPFILMFRCCPLHVLMK